MKLLYSLCMLALVAAPTGLFAQLTVADGTIWHSASSTPVRLSISGDISISSPATDFSTATLELTGTNQTLTATGDNLVNFQTLLVSLNDPATVALNGSWQINQQLTLTNGIITTGTPSHLLYSGSDAADGSIVSYVNGPFYAKGAGTFDYPIGTGTGYFPAKISGVEKGDVELGLSVVDGGANLTTGNDVTAVFNDYYYILSGDIGSAGDASRVRISLTNPDDASFETKAGSVEVVVQGLAVGGAAVSLGGQQQFDGFITSNVIPSANILTIGTSTDVQIVVYDLITPYLVDGINDKLKIANIDATESNTVTLIDRWGQVAARWTGFTNFDELTTSNNKNNQVDFDFSKLAPDSYICIVEYTVPAVAGTTASTKKIAQMVTVLKSN